METRWLTKDEQDTWLALMAASRVLFAVLDRDLLANAGMPHTYYGVLAALSSHPEGRRRLSDLAAIVDFSQSRLTHAIARMEEAGWVTREARSSSRREKDAVLTPEGWAVLEAAAPRHVELVRELVFDRLTPEQATNLREACEAILEPLIEENVRNGLGRPPVMIRSDE